MVSIPPEWQGAIRYISNLFQVRPEWLIFPNILTLFIFPLFLNIWMFAVILGKVLRIFPGGINWVLGGIIGYLMLPFNNITVFIAPFIIGVFGFQSVPIKILVMVLLYAFYLFVLPWIISGAIAGFRFGL